MLLSRFLHAFAHLILGSKNSSSDSSCLCSSSSFEYDLTCCLSLCHWLWALELHPHSLCMSIRLSGPPPFLSSPTLTKTYCTRTCQPVHIIALCVVVTSSADCTLSVYVTDSVDSVHRDPLSKKTPPPPLPLLLHPLCLPSSTGFSPQIASNSKQMVLPQSFPWHPQESHLMRCTSQHTKGEKCSYCRCGLWLCSFMLSLCCC